jgi:hypothetical protein
VCEDVIEVVEAGGWADLEGGGPAWVVGVVGVVGGLDGCLMWW